MVTERKVAFTFTLKPSIVNGAKDRLDIEKKKNPKVSLSNIIENHLEKWAAKKK